MHEARGNAGSKQTHFEQDIAKLSRGIEKLEELDYLKTRVQKIDQKAGQKYSSVPLHSGPLTKESVARSADQLVI